MKTVSFNLFNLQGSLVPAWQRAIQLWDGVAISDAPRAMIAGVRLILIQTMFPTTGRVGVCAAVLRSPKFMKASSACRIVANHKANAADEGE